MGWFAMLNSVVEMLSKSLMTMDVRPPAPTMTLGLSPILAVEPYLRILHINDSTDDQVLFQAACVKGRVPFNWHVADSAEKGMSYLKTLLEQSKNVPVCWPDLILLDNIMPMVSGFEVLKFVRKTSELSKMPVVIFTGHGFAGNREESLRLGANVFLVKPTDFHEIVELAKDLYRLVKELRNQGGSSPALPSN